MDETKRGGAMGTKLLSRLEKAAIRDILNHKHVKDAWIVGGSLLREDSPDIDILVLTDKPFDFDDCNNFSTIDYEINARHLQYEPTDNGKDIIVKMSRRYGSKETRPIDLLVISPELIPDGIKDYMDKYFPISIQRIALSVFTGEEIDYSDKDSGVVIVSNALDKNSAYIQKYMRYYPDKRFLQEVLETKESNDPPF